VVPEPSFGSVAVDLRVSQAVDVPSVIVSAFLPLRLFME
jgi:acetamidase/formamidase